jgi:hypothetical protein
MSEPQTICVSGLRFSRWTPAVVRSRKWVERSDHFTGMVLAVLSFSMLLITVDAKKLHHVSPVGSFAVAVVLVLFSVWVVLGTARHESGRGTWRIRKAEKMPKPPLPRGLPDEALPCIALVNTGSGILPREPGWVWLEDGLLRYRDEFMEFALAAGDVGELEFLLDLECADVILPAGLPCITLGLSPAIEVAGEVVKWNPGELPLVELAERWKASDPEDEGVFPPIEAAPAAKVLPWLVSGVCSGLIWCVVLLLAKTAFVALVPHEVLYPRMVGLLPWVPWFPLIGFCVVRIVESVWDVQWRQRRCREVRRLIGDT